MADVNIPTLFPSQIIDAEIEQTQVQQEADKALEEFETSLLKEIKDKWEAAKEAKADVELQMLKNMRQKAGEYDPEKLSQIREAKQPEIFLNITATKCYNAVAWTKDIMVQPGLRIFGTDHTPIPELPPEIKEQVTTAVVRQYINIAQMQAQQTGQIISSEMLRRLILEHNDEIQDKVHDAILKKARKMADAIEDLIDDHFVEGGFYEAFEKSIDDMVSVKNGFIKGPIFRKARQRKSTVSQEGRIGSEVEEKIVPQYDRRSPFSIFPSPRSLNIDDGYLFDVIAIHPRKLYSLIGVEGFDEAEIRAVLREFKDGSLKNNWLELSTECLEGLGENMDDTTYKPEAIYCLELWDEINGADLLEWGMSPDDIPDPDNDYPVCVWVIDRHVIKAMLNYDKLGRKPYSTAGFRIKNDSFWYSTVPELIADCQQVCNASARSVLANVGLGALPMIDLNIDRLEQNATREIWPGRVFPTTDEQMGAGSKAVNFYQPKMVVEQLINVYRTFSKEADEHSGVPSWTHGDTDIGGAGSTSSGLNQLITQAARGIRGFVRNIDQYLIVPCLERHYDYIINNFPIYGLMGDYRVYAKGTAALRANEQSAIRKTEFLNYTANPIDIQLIGAENRKKMLFEIAKDLGIDLVESLEALVPTQRLVQPPTPPSQSPETLDSAGNPVVGQDTRQYNPSRLRAEPSTRGYAGGAV